MKISDIKTLDEMQKYLDEFGTNDEAIVYQNEELVRKIIILMFDENRSEVCGFFDDSLNKYPAVVKVREEFKDRFKEYLLYASKNDIELPNFSCNEIIDFVIDNKIYVANGIINDLTNPKALQFLKECIDHDIMPTFLSKEIVNYCIEVGKFDLIKHEVMWSFNYEESYLYHNIEAYLDLYKKGIIDLNLMLNSIGYDNYFEINDEKVLDKIITYLKKCVHDDKLRGSVLYLTPSVVNHAIETNKLDDIVYNLIFAYNNDYVYANLNSNKFPFFYHNDGYYMDLYYKDILSFNYLIKAVDLDKIRERSDDKVIKDLILSGNDLESIQINKIKSSPQLQKDICDLIRNYPQITANNYITYNELDSIYPIYVATFECITVDFSSELESLLSNDYYSKLFHDDRDNLRRVIKGLNKNGLTYDLRAYLKYVKDLDITKDFDNIKLIIESSTVVDENFFTTMLFVLSMCKKEEEKVVVDYVFDTMINKGYYPEYDYRGNNQILGYLRDYKKDEVLNNIDKLYIGPMYLEEYFGDDISKIPKDKMRTYVKNMVKVINDKSNYITNCNTLISLAPDIYLDCIKPTKHYLSSLCEYTSTYKKNYIVAWKLISQYLEKNKDQILLIVLLDFPMVIVDNIISFDENILDSNKGLIKKLLGYTNCNPSSLVCNKLHEIIINRFSNGGSIKMDFFSEIEKIYTNKELKDLIDRELIELRYNNDFYNIYKRFDEYYINVFDSFIMKLASNDPNNALSLVYDDITRFDSHSIETKECIISCLKNISNQSTPKHVFIANLSEICDEEKIIQIIEEQNYDISDLCEFLNYPKVFANHEKIKDYLFTRMEKEKFTNVSDSYAIHCGDLVCDERLYQLLLKNECIDIELFLSNVIHERIKNVPRNFYITHLDEIIEHEGIPADKKNNMIRLFDFYGIQFIQNLQSDNLKVLISYSTEELSRYLELVKERPLNETQLRAINNSLNLRDFEINNHDVMLIKNKILAAIGSGELDSVKENYSYLLAKYVDEDLCRLFKMNSKLEFMYFLFDMLYSDLNDYIGIFQEITDKYINDEKNQQSQIENIYKDCNISYEYDQKQLRDMVFNYIKTYYARELKTYIITLDIQDKLLKKDVSKELDLATYDYLLGNDINVDETMVKKNIAPLKKRVMDSIFSGIEYNNEKKEFSLMWEEDYDLSKVACKICNDPELTKNVKKNILLPSRRNTLSSEITSVDFNLLKIVIDNDELYPLLLGLMKKYSFLDWGNIFSKHLNGEYSYDMKDYLNVLCYFDKIINSEILDRKKSVFDFYERVKRYNKLADDMGDDSLRVSEELTEQIVNELLHFRFTPAKVVKYAHLYTNKDNYGLNPLLGKEDASIFIANAEPFSGFGKPNERAKRVTDIYLRSFKQQEVVIPSFIKDYDLGDKSIQVIVGNRTAPYNMTHGERTGACLRVNGFDDDFFEFAATNKFGFHITFKDAETGEYISRITGFRNGNTVFLNQLRHSTSEKYNNVELIQTLREVGEDLIELTKDDKIPIQNVVADGGYALSGYSEIKVCDLNNIGNGVYNGHRDVNNIAVVLATDSYNTKEPTKVVLGTDNMPTYKCVRLYPKEIYDYEAIIDSIKRIHYLKEYYEDGYYDEYELEQVFKYAIVGDDWFVAVDADNNVISEYIEGDDRLFDEYNAAIERVNEMISSNQIEKGNSI